MSIAEKLVTIAENILKVYEAGAGRQEERITALEEQNAKVYELIETITVEEEITTISRSESYAIAYNFQACMIRATFPAGTGKSSNINITYYIGAQENAKKLVSYMISPFNSSAQTYGFSRAWLDYDRWMTGWWTCSTGAGQYAYHHENPRHQGEHTINDGYITNITMGTGDGIPVGTTIEIWGVRA